MSSIEELRTLFEQWFGARAERVDPLDRRLGASPRRLFRLIGDRSRAIGVVYGVRQENVAFLDFSRHFRRHGLPVPEIYAANLDRNVYLEEDLGDTTLYQFLRRNTDGDTLSTEVLDAYRKVVALLPRFQVEAGRDLNYDVCYPRASFDRQSIAWDLHYFKYYFLNLAGIEFDEQALEDDFQRLTDFLLEADRDYFLYRDFQSRNVMLVGDEPYFVDYQGGRRGALQYDIASLLYDAKADLPPGVRRRLFDAYLDALGERIDLDRDRFIRHYDGYVYIRIMQAMGAYGFRGFFERKTHFLDSIPYALGNVRWLLDNTELPIELPALFGAFRKMLGSERLGSVGSVDRATIRVRIFSFSFHRDTLVDDSGHGGGFVFDARNLPNPGREDSYRDLTGRDAPVADYLAAQPGVDEYLAHVTSLVDASVAAYRKRGFQSLMVSFGCTGGQHRSVYLAERLAGHLGQKAGVDVVLRHLGLERLGR